MNFPESYFETEVREGFEISALMKRCWAAQLEVLEQFDGICKKHGLKYYAAFGTLLGTVRHGGFVPWDDDMDVWMLRRDVEILLSECINDIKDEGLELVTAYTKDDYNNLVVRLNNTQYFSLDEDFLMRYHLFPFTAGVDIFILDTVPDREADINNMRRMLAPIVVLEKEWDKDNLTAEEKLSQYREITEILGVEQRPVEEIHRHLWKMIDDVCAKHRDEDSEWIAVLNTYFAGNIKYKRKWFEETSLKDFEGCFQMPCPSESNEVLLVAYGENYMTPLKVIGSHGYPYYRSRQEVLKKFLAHKGIPCPKIYE